MIYYIIWALLMLLSLNEINVSPKNRSIIVYGRKKISCKNLGYLCVVIILIVFGGTRDQIGIDFNTYKDIFLKVSNGTFIAFIEPMFYVIVKLFKSFSSVILIYTALSVGTKAIYICKNSNYVWCSLLIYYSIYFLRFDMGMVRQSVAIGTSLLGLYFLYEKKKWKFVCMILLSCCFHYSAIIMLLALVIYKRRIRYRFMVISSLIAFGLSFTNIWYLIIKIFLKVFSFLPISKYQAYIGDSNYIYNEFAIGDVQKILFLFVMIYLLYKYGETEKLKYLLVMYYCGTMIFYLFKTFTTLSDRGSAYFVIVEIILLPYFINILKNKLTKNTYLFLLGGYTLYYLNAYVHFTSTSWMNELYIPYKSWFFY